MPCYRVRPTIPSMRRTWPDSFDKHKRGTVYPPFLVPGISPRLRLRTGATYLIYAVVFLMRAQIHGAVLYKHTPYKFYRRSSRARARR
ncbi:hypothetical protein BV25DRAFT_1822953 [Artomyces pyxidatus]|uniref:Uncharacterized protein n=1 Tax=Artomyces pyxidatus TaxID=48021 RepID=A0ACB8T8U9_9AGAM|nr:hypothetical protein BV25DRAFT_1822953 [Artomyces pyxidatus]